MHLIGALASGVKGAESGSAVIRRRGTSTPATWYSDFEGTSSSTSTVSLDSNGGAAVYVNELVDVVVSSSSGSEVRTFTAGVDAPAVEVKSSSFKGTNYETAMSAAGEPTTLQSVLDKWKTSAGAIDFNILVDGSSTTLQSFAGVLSGYLFNVQSDAYGAVGDGSTNDYAAVQAAIDAAEAAGGGIVFFPSGTYRVETGLTAEGGVMLLGVTSGVSKIEVDDAVALGLTASGAGTVVIDSLSIYSDAANSNGLIQADDTDDTSLLVRNCVIGSASAESSTAISKAGGSGTIKLLDSEFHAAGQCFLVLTGSGTVTAERCSFSTATATNAQVTLLYALGHDLFVDKCTFDPSSITTTSSASAGVLCTGDIIRVTDSQFFEASGGTYTAFGTVSGNVEFITNGVYLAGDLEFPSSGLNNRSRIQRRPSSNLTVSSAAETLDADKYSFIDVLINDSAEVVSACTFTVSGEGSNGDELVVAFRVGSGADCAVTLAGVHQQSFTDGTLVGPSETRILRFIYLSSENGWVEAGTSADAS